MLGFNNYINLCNRFATSIYLCFITVYVTLWNKEYITKQIIHMHSIHKDEAEIVNKDDKNDSDDKESGQQG